MQMLDVADVTWRKLLGLYDGHETIFAEDEDAAASVYAPIARSKGRFVIAQVGQSLDGRVATPAGDARDISGAGGLVHLHRCRALVDALIVGINTVKADDPRLSVRLVEGRDPVRVVVDCHGALNGQESLFHDNGAPVLVIQSGKVLEERTFPNAEIVRLGAGENGLETGEILDVLESRGLKRVLVEGGARTIARFIDEGHVDRLHVAVSPLIIGSGPVGIGLAPIEKLSSALRPKTTVYDLGPDILFDCAFNLSA
ncbi:RibD family protein [Martelella mediterranea]|uniref:Riboflavin-specific deaminase-like protein n=1 Tax=Martelella mediterranea TaxID=293089 RepID=A0A4R3NUR7_9HYPH|nr:RibD family protein [Martelella mediterranea]TCT36291.1 riboflavin-specific deaminase-like protein [Martelella mediterranea]